MNTHFTNKEYFFAACNYPSFSFSPSFLCLLPVPAGLLPFYKLPCHFRHSACRCFPITDRFSEVFSWYLQHVVINMPLWKSRKRTLQSVSFRMSPRPSEWGTEGWQEQILGVWNCSNVLILSLTFRERMGPIIERRYRMYSNQLQRLLFKPKSELMNTRQIHFNLSMWFIPKGWKKLMILGGEIIKKLVVVEWHISWSCEFLPIREKSKKSCHQQPVSHRNLLVRDFLCVTIGKRISPAIKN